MDVRGRASHLLRSARAVLTRHPRRAGAGAAWAGVALVAAVAWSQVAVRVDGGAVAEDGVAVPLEGPSLGAVEIAVGAGAIWAVGLHDRRLRTFPAAEGAGEPRRVGAEGDLPADAVARGDRAWVALQRSGTGAVVRLDDRGRTLGVRSTGYLRPSAIAVLPGRIVAVGDGRVGGFATAGARSWSRPLPEPVDVAVGYRSLWTLSRLDGARSLVTRRDPGTGRVTGRRIAPAGATAIAVGHGAVWIANGCVNGVLRAPVGPGPGTCVPVGKGPSDVAVAGGAAWATDGAGSRVVELDPVTGAVVRSWPTPGRPASVSAHGATVAAATVRGRIVRLERG